jgi:hypothetical protein
MSITRNRIIPWKTSLILSPQFQFNVDWMSILNKFTNGRVLHDEG